MLRGGLRRRAVLAAAPVVLSGMVRAAELAPVLWYAGPATARTDPFIPWACEAMHARTGLRVRRTLDPAAADVVCTSRAEAARVGLREVRPIAWCGAQSVAGISPAARQGAGPAQFAAFLASSAATTRAACGLG